MNASPFGTILVAEDNAISREVLMHQLRLLGRAAVAVEDGSAALRAWRGGAFALLLTDLEMPGLDGRELARMIRSGPVRCHAPVVLLSAEPAPADGRYDDVAIDEMLTKPATIATLREVLAKWLGPVTPAKLAVAIHS